MSTHSEAAEDELAESDHQTGDYRDHQLAVEKAKVYALLDIASALRGRYEPKDAIVGIVAPVYKFPGEAI